MPIALLPSRRPRIPCLEFQVEEIDAWIVQFKQALKQPQIREALVRDGAQELWQERAFALRTDSKLLQGRFDRVALWNDRAVLVDFKTDAAGLSVRFSKYMRPVVFQIRPVSLIDRPKGHLIMDSQSLGILVAEFWRHYDSPLIVETDKA